MNRLTNHRARRHRFAVACIGSAFLLQAAANADVVQGTVTPANAKVIIKDSAGNQVSELSAGPFQIRLPAGRFTAQCQAPSQKTVQVFSLAQPTTANIDCT
jgi:phosphate-selective porin